MMIELVAKRAALAYRRACRWASVEDMKQEALVGILDARENYDPARGTPLDAYFYRVAVFAISRFLWNELSPVSGRRRSLQRARPKREEVNEETEAIEEVETETPAERCDRKTTSASVRARIAVLGRSDPEVDFGFRSLLSGEPPRRWAAKLGIDIETIYRCRARARARGSVDAELLRLWVGE